MLMLQFCACFISSYSSSPLRLYSWLLRGHQQVFLWSRSFTSILKSLEDCLLNVFHSGNICNRSSVYLFHRDFLMCKMKLRRKRMLFVAFMINAHWFLYFCWHSYIFLCMFHGFLNLTKNADNIMLIMFISRGVILHLMSAIEFFLKFAFFLRKITLWLHKQNIYFCNVVLLQAAHSCTEKKFTSTKKVKNIEWSSFSNSYPTDVPSALDLNF